MCGKYKERQTDRQTETQTDRQSETETETEIGGIVKKFILTKMLQMR